MEAKKLRKNKKDGPDEWKKDDDDKQRRRQHTATLKNVDKQPGRIAKPR